MACYKAKDQGRNRVVVYHPSDEHLIARFGEMAWVQRLQAALQNNRFSLHAQPIIALQDTGQSNPHYELLLRLYDEQGHLVSPGVFIPAAERFGMMGLIDRWVVNHALNTIASRVATGAAQPQTLFAINLSGSSLAKPDFLVETQQAFARYGVSHRQVCFEITETQAVAHLADTVHFLNEMRALGCSFALDHFGAGMSSFLYLKHLPINYLKIDGNLVKGITDHATDRAMVEMIHHLGRTMKIKTVGEYAETEDTVRVLREIGIDYAQGFAIGYPELWSGQ